MVGRASLLLLTAAACSFSEPADQRRSRDEQVGTTETGAYRFEAADGLLHVLEAGEDALTARATSTAFRLTLTRKVAALERVRLRLVNLHPDVRLTAAPGVLEEGGPEPLLHLARAWTVRFPPGVDVVELTSGGLPAGDFTFLAFGDIQTGIDAFDEVVEAVNREEGIDFILMLGDLTQRATPEEFAEVEEAFARIRWPIYSTPGNHDVFERRTYQDRFGRASYSLVHRGARFTSVDSASGGLDPRTWEWVEGWFREGRDQLHVAFSHIPAIEVLGIRGGQWNSPREGRKFVGLGLAHRLDLLLFGHIHTYDGYSLGGIPTHISGGCGAIPERLDGIERHYLRVHASPARGTLDVEVVRVE